jgi:hypothetical protein
MVVGNTPTAREKNSLPEGRAPASANEQTEEPVEQIQLWARMTPLEHDELLTKCQIFEQNMAESYSRTLVATTAAVLLIPHRSEFWRDSVSRKSRYVQ